MKTDRLQKYALIVIAIATTIIATDTVLERVAIVSDAAMYNASTTADASQSCKGRYYRGKCTPVVVMQEY